MPGSRLTVGSLSDAFTLTIRQGPEIARCSGPKEKDRKPIDPPPIIGLSVDDPLDPAQNYISSPYLFLVASLLRIDANSKDVEPLSSQDVLSGSLVSSLHRLKDADDIDKAFFVFGDISVKHEGEYRLRFSLYEIHQTAVTYLTHVISGPFTVYSIKAFPGLPESTQLSRAFSEQGIKLRIRKDNRGSARMGKRAASSMSANGCHPTYTNASSPLRPENTMPIQLPSMVVYGSHQNTNPSEPAFKRYRRSIDINDRMTAGPPYPDRTFGTGMERPNVYGTYGTSHQLTSAYAPASNSYAPAPNTYAPASHHGSSSLGNISNFSYGHQRTDSSDVSSPFVSQVDGTGQYWGTERWAGS